MADIFISYSSNDAQKVGRLVGALKAKGANVWFDDEQILPGDDLIQKMSEGISQCRYYVICLSPSFEKKPPTSWVKKEFKMAMIKEKREGKQNIIPVRIKKGGSIPDEIGEKAYADLTTAKRWAKNLPKLCKALGI
jgi:TIR domain-containing protein